VFITTSHRQLSVAPASGSVNRLFSCELLNSTSSVSSRCDHPRLALVNSFTRQTHCHPAHLGSAHLGVDNLGPVEFAPRQILDIRTRQEQAFEEAPPRRTGWFFLKAMRPRVKRASHAVDRSGFQSNQLISLSLAIRIGCCLAACGRFRHHQAASATPCDRNSVAERARSRARNSLIPGSSDGPSTPLFTSCCRFAPS